MTDQNVIARKLPRPEPPSGEPWDTGILAAHDGTCPICSRYIRAGRSRITPLIVPLPPDPKSLYCRRGAFFDRGNVAIRLHRRSWVHADCARGLDTSEEALSELAAERVEKLTAMRRESKARGRQQR
jgi:hypothetical protein